MNQHMWSTIVVVSFTTLIGLTFLWVRLPVYRWFCHRCRKTVSTSRFHPSRCTCDTNTLVAYFCDSCGSWNTSSTSDRPIANRQCVACSSRDVRMGYEYNINTGCGELAIEISRSFF
jgi:hypothetical protein